MLKRLEQFIFNVLDHRRGAMLTANYTSNQNQIKKATAYCIWSTNLSPATRISTPHTHFIFLLLTDCRKGKIVITVSLLLEISCCK